MHEVPFVLFDLIIWLYRKKHASVMEWFAALSVFIIILMKVDYLIKMFPFTVSSLISLIWSDDRIAIFTIVTAVK